MMNHPPRTQQAASASRLYGWDDEKVYFWSPQTGEKCVSDESELIQKLIGICAEYFRAARETNGQ